MITYKMFVDIYPIPWCHYKIIKLMKIIEDISTVEEALASTLIVRKYFKEDIPEDGHLSLAAIHCET